MKINKTKKTTTSKKLLMTICIILGCVILAIFTARAIGIFDVQKTINKKLTAQVDKTSAIKQDQTNNNTTNSDLPSKSSGDSGVSISSSKANVETPTTPPEKPYLSRADLSTNGDIKVVATFQQSSPGYCELQLSNTNKQKVVKEAYIVLGTSYYSCSFSVPKNTLSNNGQWDIVVIHHIGKSSTTSDIKVIEVN